MVKLAELEGHTSRVLCLTQVFLSLVAQYSDDDCLLMLLMNDSLLYFVFVAEP
jgi:hypothetical protein